MRVQIHLTALAGVLFVASASCASVPRPQASALTRPAEAVEATPAKPVTDQPTEATLVVRREIVRACPPLTELRDRAAVVPPDAFWIAVLDGLAGCMQKGALRGRSVVLHGAKPGRDLVAYFLAARGVSPDRVASEPGPDTSTGQVEISLGSVAGAEAAK